MPSKKKKKGGWEVEFKKKLASFISGLKKWSKDVAGGTFSKEVIAGGIVMIGVIAVIIFGFLASNKNVPLPEISIPSGSGPTHPLTGKSVDQSLDDSPRVFAVMVENAADAWPLSGINEAFLVVEAPVEGDIPRFITFFHEDNDTQKIGPVRSARPYYLDWAAEFDALYAHVGGSPEALDLIANSDLRDVNEFFNADTFYRQHSGRFAPHNVFTFIDLLTDAWDTKSFENPDYEYWKFEEKSAQGGESVEIDWADGSLYDVFWEFDSSENAYLRHQGNDVMEPEDGENIWADNIIVMATDIRTIDNVGRKEIRTIGEGDAMIFRRGVSELVTWKKESAEDRLRFFDASGEEITLQSGVTWIEVVYDLDQIEIKNGQ